MAWVTAPEKLDLGAYAAGLNIGLAFALMLGAAATIGGCVEAVLVADLVINDCAGNLSLVLNIYIFQSYH